MHSFDILVREFLKYLRWWTELQYNNNHLFYLPFVWSIFLLLCHCFEFQCSWMLKLKLVLIRRNKTRYAFFFFWLGLVSTRNEIAHSILLNRDVKPIKISYLFWFRHCQSSQDINLTIQFKTILLSLEN